MISLTSLLHVTFCCLAMPQVAEPPQAEPETLAPAESASESKFATAQLEQIVAPIALYPDVLLSQVLMASTYPLEIVAAHRFVQANPKLEGDALEAELKEKDWDPSVKSMCGFPDLLARMNDNLDWLRDLGDAFLAQEAELMEAVQQMRRTAHDAGTLKSSTEQSVVERDDVIVIEPASPEVIYVPVYYPTYVYGGWGYPWWYYPRLYVAPPAASPFFYYRVGFAGFGWGPWPHWMWGRCNWNRGHSHVDVDVHVHNTFVRRTSSHDRHVITPPGDVGRDRSIIDGAVGRADGRDIGHDAGRVAWKHDPAHRRGVNYRDAATRRRVQPDAPATARPDRPDRFTRPTPDDLRGRTRSSRDEPRTRRDDSSPPRTEPRTEPRPPRTREDDVTTPRSRTTPPTPRTSRSRSRDDAMRALDGSRNPALDRAARERGYRSLRPYWQRNRVQPPRASPPRSSPPRVREIRR